MGSYVQFYEKVTDTTLTREELMDEVEKLYEAEYEDFDPNDTKDILLTVIYMTEAPIGVRKCSAKDKNAIRIRFMQYGNYFDVPDNDAITAVQYYWRVPNIRITFGS